MATGYRKFYKGVNLEPNTTTTVTSAGDLDSNSTDGKATYFNGVAGTASPVVTEAHTATLTNKTLSGNTATNLVSGSGTLTLNTTGTITVPNATDTLVGKATTDTLTNKTLSGNTATNLISGAGTFTFNTTGTITSPNATDTLVGKATTDTLTNKTISGASNTITNVSLTTGVTGTLPVGNGGTGQNSALTANGVVYATSTTAMAVTAAGTAGQALISAGSGSPPAYSSTFGPTTGGNIVGTNTNNNAAAGQVGEFVVASPGAPVTPGTSGTVVNFTSISLTAGDWDVDGSVSLATGATSAISQLSAFVTLTSAAIDSANSGAFFQELRSAFNVSSTYLYPIGTRRISIATTTTVFIAGTIVYTTLGGATFNQNGILIRARRVR